VAPTTLALLAEVFPEGKPRNAAVGVWAVITTVSGSLGMLAGGLLTDGPGWRWVFWVNVPVAALVIVGGLRFLPVDGPVVRRAGFDLVGAVGLTGGVCLLVTAAVTPSPALFAGAVLVLGYATVHELVVARNPLLPKALLRMPSVLAANLTQALCGGGMLVMFYVVTLYQQNVLHYTALQTALAYLPHTAVLVLAARLAPALIAMIGPRRAVCLGAFAGTVGMALLARAPVDGSFATAVLVPSLILGAAIPLTLIPNTTEALAGVPPSLHGAASSLVNVSRVLGGTLSLAVVSAVAAALSHESLGIPVEAALANGYRVALVVGAGLFFSAAVVAIVPVRRHPRAAMPA
jgi:MFS family permease